MGLPSKSSFEPGSKQCDGGSKGANRVGYPPQGFKLSLEPSMSKKGETLITPMGDLTPERAPSVAAQDVRGREEEEARRGFHAWVNAAERCRTLADPRQECSKYSTVP